MKNLELGLLVVVHYLLHYLLSIIRAQAGNETDNTNFGAASSLQFLLVSHHTETFNHTNS